MELSQKLTTYWVTKQTSTDTKNWNNPMYLIGSPWLKIRIKQQHQFQKAHKHIEIKQCSPKSPMGQGRNKGKN